MQESIPNGVWPTMLTPLTDDLEVDYGALEELIEWYIANKVDGLFAVCQSSEMFYLSLDERVKIAEFVVETAGGRVPVIASGHISYGIDAQAQEVKAIADTGVEAVVLVTNRMANDNQSDEVWKSNTEKIMQAAPEATFGLYECPHPYKRLLTPELMKWCASTERILFLKDTSCDLDEIEAKLKAIKGTNLKIFNANASTLLDSVKMGACGFSGVMANFHPELYVWLMENWEDKPELAEELQAFLGVSSLIERQLYSTNAKYYLQLEGLNIGLASRGHSKRLASAEEWEVKQLRMLSKHYVRKLSIS